MNVCRNVEREKNEISDIIRNFAEFLQLLDKCSCIPGEYSVIRGEQWVIFIAVNVQNVVPEIKCSVKSNSFLSVEMTVCGVPVASQNYKHLLLKGKLSNFSQVIQLLLYANNMQQCNLDGTSGWLECAEKCLEHFVECSEDITLQKKVLFLLEQISLMTKKKQVVDTQKIYWFALLYGILLVPHVIVVF